MTAVGALMGLAGVAVSTTLGILCGYTALVVAVSPSRLKRVLSTVQIVAPAVLLFAPIYIDDLLVPLLDPLARGSDIGYSGRMGLHCAPGCGTRLSFRSSRVTGYPLVRGGGDGRESRRFAVLFFLASRRLSLSYAERLGMIFGDQCGS